MKSKFYARKAVLFILLLLFSNIVFGQKKVVPQYKIADTELFVGVEQTYEATTDKVSYASFSLAAGKTVDISNLATSIDGKSYSIFMWKRNRGYSSGNVQVLLDIVSGDDVSSLLIDTNHELALERNDVLTSGGTSAFSASWHLVGYTFDVGSKDIKMYVDGILVKTYSDIDFGISSSSTISLGRSFWGYLSEVSVWDTVLEESDILSLKEEVITADHPKYANLLAYYTMQVNADGDLFEVTNAANTNLNAVASVNDVLSTKSLSSISGYNSSSRYSVEWKKNQESISTKNTITLSGAESDEGEYSLEFSDNHFNIIDLWTVTIGSFAEQTQDIMKDTYKYQGESVSLVAETNLVNVVSYMTPESSIDLNVLAPGLTGKSYTTSAWVMPGFSLNERAILGIYDNKNFSLVLDANGNLYFNNAGVKTLCNHKLSSSLWHHIAYSYDRSTGDLELYINGDLVESLTSMFHAISSSSKIVLGSEFDADGNKSHFFDGQIAEASFWNDVLELADIVLLKEQAIESSHPKYANLLAYYTMQMGSDADRKSIVDISTNSLNGTASSDNILRVSELYEIEDYNSSSNYNIRWKKEDEVVSNSTEYQFDVTGESDGTYKIEFYTEFATITDEFDLTSFPAPSDNDPFVFIVESDETDFDQLVMLKNGTNIQIDWGDGNVELVGDVGDDRAEMYHTYADAGSYTVEISAENLSDLSFVFSKNYMVELVSFGNINLNNVLLSSSVLTKVPDYLPSNLTNLDNTFAYCTIFNGDLSKWDVSHVTSMASMFNYASAFNGDISDWDVSNVTSMAIMFKNASVFNGDISDWDVSSVTNMNMLFASATSFNGDISDWNVSNASHMWAMFNGAIAFNGDLSEWDVSHATTMASMFLYATSFNGDLSAWDVSKVTNMYKMFGYTSSFNGDLSAWDISAVIDIRQIFDNTTAPSIPQYDDLLNGWAETAPEYAHNLVMPEGTYYSQKGKAGRDILISKGWTITDNGLSSIPMVLKYNTALSDGTAITLPLHGAEEVTVDWGDGQTTTSINTTSTIMRTRALLPSVDHTYAEEGVYEIKIFGSVEHFGSATAIDGVDKLIEVVSFGDLGIESLANAFTGAINLVSVPEQLPASVTDLSQMFSGAVSFDDNIGTWSIENVTTMDGMFSGVALSNDIYNNLLEAWATSSAPLNVIFDAGDSYFLFNSFPYKQYLVEEKGWQISDLGLFENFDLKMTIEANSIEIANLDNIPSVADNTDFYNTAISADAVINNFKIKNSGTGTLQVSNIELTGKDVADFSVASNSIEVPGGEERELSISFDPTTLGAKLATLSFETNSFYTPEFSFALTGTGIPTPNIFTQETLENQTVCENTNLTISSSTAYTNYASLDDANSDWVQLNNLIAPLEGKDRSVFLWMKKEVAADENQILVGINENSGDFNISNLMVTKSGLLSVYDGEDSRNSTINVVDGQWHYVGYTYEHSSTETKLYIDGVVVKTFSDNQSFDSSDYISLGVEFDGNNSKYGNYYEGFMTEVSFWDVILSEDEIKLTMASAIDGAHPKRSNLVAYYPMLVTGEDTDLSVIKDYSGNNYHGTASSALLISTDNCQEVSAFNASSHYTSLWTRNNISISTDNTLQLNGALTDAGEYVLKLERDYVSITNAFNISINPVPVISTQPKNASVAVGGEADFEVVANEGTFGYQWYKPNLDETFINLTISDGLGSNGCNDVYESAGVIYVATGDGLSISTDGGASFINKTTADGLGSNSCNRIYESDGVIYIATQGGLSISTDGGNTFTNKTTADGLGDNTCYAIYESDGILYVGTNDGLSISTNEGVSFTNKLFETGYSNSPCNDIYVSNEAIYVVNVVGLFISTNGGNSFTQKTTDDGLVHSNCRSIYASAGVIYIATQGGLSISTDGGTSFINKTADDGLANSNCVSVYVSDGVLYVGTQRGLSISTDGGNTFTNKTFADGMGNDYCRSEFESNGDLYVGTSGGFSILFKNIPIQGATIPQLTVPAVTPDMYGNEYFIKVSNPTSGCSVVSNTVKLNACEAITSTDTQTACGEYTWIDGITYTESNTTATHTITSKSGCKEVVTLNLTINPLPEIATQPSDFMSTLGGNASFTVDASGAGLEYQWMEAKYSVDNKTSISGVSGTIYSTHIVGDYYYLGTSEGLAVSTDGGETFNTYTTGLSSNLIYSVTELNGSIYVGTLGSGGAGSMSGGGLSISADGGKTFLVNKTVSNGFIEDDVRTIYIADGTIYVGTYSGGLGISTDNGQSFISKTTADGLPDNECLGIFKSEGVLYVATDAGLAISTDNGNTFSVRGTDDGLQSRRCTDVYVVDNIVYVTTFSGLSISYDGGNTFTSISKGDNGLPSSYAFTNVSVDNGVIYIGSYDGFYISEDNGASFTKPEGLSDDRVYSLYVNDGIVYLPSSIGLSEYQHFASLSGATENVFNVSNVTAEMEGNEYFVEVTNPSTGCSVVSSTAKLNISPTDFMISATELEINENVGTETFTVVLSEQPASNVVLNLSSNDISETVVDKSTLTFTTSNWNIAQTVTVTGVDDSDMDGAQIATITISVDDANSDDVYDNLSDKTIAVTVVDDESSLVFEYNTSLSSGTTVELPVADVSDISVDWGDGTVNTSLSHTYASEGIYIVSVSGLAVGVLDGANNTSSDKLIKVLSFGDLDISSFRYAFKKGSNLSEVPSSLPTGVTDLVGAFSYASSFNGDLSAWDVSSVQNMSSLFNGASSFTSDLSSWDVSSVTKMTNMFNNVSSFTSNLENWDVSSVQNMSGLFRGASSFTSDLSRWDVSKVTTMTYMFYGVSSFNSDLNSWDVSKVTNFSAMFNDARLFNGNISSWNTSSATNMSQMFLSAYNFNQDISLWNASSVYDMSYMFRNASAFNQDISAWNTSSVTSMAFMFYGASDFNQNVSSWNTSNVTNMSMMFKYASDFNQDVSAWDISQVTNMNDILANTSFSTENYDKLLNAWAQQEVQSNVIFGVGTTQYTAAALEAKQKLINDYGWTITDGGMIELTTPDYSVSLTKLNVNEGDNTTFTVVLAGKPASNVVINLNSNNTSEVTVLPAKLTFTPNNWNSPQTAALNAVADNTVDGDQISTITLTIDKAASDNDFDALANKTVEVTTTDIDTPNFIISETVLHVSESGSSAMSSIKLSAKPTSNVVLNIENNFPDECTVLPTSIIFTPENYNAEQNIQVTGVDDNSVDGLQVVQLPIVVDNEKSADAYDALNITPLTVKVDDNDISGVTLSKTLVHVNEDGNSDNFSVVLNTSPANDVIIYVISTDESEAIVLPALLTFTKDNWNSPQTVTVSGVDDSLIDGVKDVAIEVGVDEKNSDNSYHSVNDKLIIATVDDNDTPGFTLSESNLKVNENGTQENFTIVLNTKPTADVVIDLKSLVTSQVAVSPAQLTFTENNWNSEQTVVVLGQDDALVDGTQVVKVEAAINSATSDANYTALNTKFVEVTIDDNDTPSFTLSENSLTVSESENTKTFTLVLDAQPVSDVVFKVTNSDNSEATVAPIQLTFTTDNWNSPQTIAVTGANDDIIDGTQQTKIKVAVFGESSDEAFSNLIPQEVTVSVEDNDTPEFVISHTQTQVSEDGVTAEVSIGLSAKPLTNVVIDFVSSDTGEATVTPASITFTPNNWNSKQSVVVTGVDDNALDGSQLLKVSAKVNSLDSDAAFVNLLPQSFNVTVLDNDTPGFTVSKNKLSVSENGSTESFTVVLDAMPLSDVVLDVTSSATDEATVAPVRLTFTAENWNSPQTVVVTGADDALVDGQQTAKITVAVNKTDSNSAFEKLLANTVTVEVADNDTPDYQLSENLLTVSENGTSASFNVVLTAKPTSNVVFDLTSTADDEMVLSPAQLTFTPNNWNSAQKVVVVGINDNVVDGKQYASATLSVVPNATDDAFDNLLTKSVSIGVDDNDTPGFVLSEKQINVCESGTTASFTLALSAKPLSNVVFSILNSDSGEAIISTSELTFTPENWSSTQVVQVTGANDNLVDGEQTSSIKVYVEPARSDNAFGNLLAEYVTVNVADNDSPGLVVSETELVVAENGTTANFSVALAARPIADVIIDLSSTATNEATVLPASIVFTTNNWNSPQSAIVTGVDDALVDGQQTANISVAVNAANSTDAYDNVLPSIVSVQVTDNDTPNYELSESKLTVSEDGTTASFSVVLTAQPTSNVTFNLNSTLTDEATVYPAQLTFSPDNWNTQQTVWVTGADDKLVDGTQYTKATVSVVPTSTDDTFDNLLTKSITVTVQDNDTPGFTVSESNLAVNESGTSASFSVVLTAQPLSNVVIESLNSDANEATVSLKELTFTPNNWNIPQQVQVTGTDDEAVDGNQSVRIALSVNQTKTDNAFDYLATEYVSVTVNDNDTPGFSVSTTSLTVTENGTSESFGVALTAQPESNVVIDLSSKATDEVTVSPTSLLFTTANWNVEQVVSVNGVDDNIVDGNQNTTVNASINAAETDNAFDNVTFKTIAVTNTDNDTPGFTLSESELRVSEAGTMQTFTVLLSAQPTSNVVFNLMSSGADEISLSTATLTFTPTNWNNEQTITVTGEDDDIRDGDKSVLITIGVDAANSDDTFDALLNQSVSVTNEDNEIDYYTVRFNVTDGLEAIQAASIVVNAQTIVSDASGNVTIDLPNGAFAWQCSAAGYNNIAGELTVKGATTNVDVAMQLIFVNNVPVFTSSDAVSINENTTAIQTVIATDKDAGDSQTYSIVGGEDQSLFEIDAVAGELTFTNAPDFELATDTNKDNVYKVEVAVTDAGGNTISQTISVRVKDVSEFSGSKPVISSSNTPLVAENTTSVITVTATDSDAGDTQSFSISGGADKSLFAINATTGELTFVSAPNFESAADTNTDNVYEVEVTVTDAGGNTTSQTISVRVTNVSEFSDNAPVITSSNTATVSENKQNVFTVTATDIDLNDLQTYSISGGSDQYKFDIDESTGELTFVDAPNYEEPTDSDENNSYNVEVTVTDRADLFNTQLITVTVTNVNEIATDNGINASDLLSPNGDGKNEYWLVKNVDELKSFNLYIFNNIGEVVYETVGYQNNWDATYKGIDLPKGTYYYMFRKGDTTYKGVITVVR